MVLTFFATFPAGTYDILVKSLKSFSVAELTILSHDDSSVTFQSTVSIEKLIELRFFTNVFLVYNKPANVPRFLIKGEYFRLMQLTEGIPQPLPASQRTSLQNKISKDFKLKPHAKLSKNDFYVINRRNNETYIGLKLSRAKFKREVQIPGSLRPELAHILCLAAGLKAKHTIVDMFAGSGAIAIEAARGFGCHKVIAIEKAAYLQTQQHPAITWRIGDATALDFLTDSSVDRIITDPPWGSFDTNIDLATLYKASSHEVERLLRPTGIAVILSDYADAQEVFTHTKKLELVNKWPILVSGHKAVIYKLRKK